MADLRISELVALAGVDLAGGDLLPVVDTSAGETKKITVLDAIGYGITLINDATIPGAKIIFNAGTLNGSALATGTVGTNQLTDDGVTAAKLADESTVDLVTTLPASGAYVGQLALDTDDSKLYCWSGSAWVSFKAAGSVNTVVGDTAGIVNLSVATSGDTVTITTSLDNTSGAAQFLAGPTATAGVVSYRQIASGDLPTASSSGKGGVAVNGSGLTMSGEQIVIDNTVAASGATFGVVQYNNKGLVTSGRAITSADLPAATSVDKGAVTPGTGLAAGVAGALNHSNSVTAGTATKVTFDAQGHITATQALLDTDIPSLSAGKITSGTLAVNLIGTNSITGAKLANSSTVLFGGAANTAGVVTFPVPDFQGQQFFDALHGDLYLFDGAAWQPITITAGELIYAGTYNANLNQVKSTTAAGTAAGLVVGNALPAASSSNLRYYVVVADSGTGVAPAPVVALAPPDMLVSSGTAWELIDVSNGIAGQLASNISFTPSGNIAATDVQAAIQEVDTEKLAKAGGTVTGELEIGTTGSLVFEGNTLNASETTLSVVDPTADRTILLPDVSGTLLTTGSTGAVTSSMILDGTIVNDDINASAGIVDTKLATISTAGKVSNSATTATNANTASAIVARDASGNFSAGTITASLTGNVTGDLTGTASAIADGTVTSAKIVDGTIVDGDINASAEIAVSKLADGAARQLLQTDAAGTDVEWTSNVDIPGTLDVTGATTLDSTLSFPLGAAATPSIYPGADTNTGFYSPGADQVAVATAGTERIRVGASGEIGLSGANYGTNGQVLTSGGSGVAPTWTTPASGGGGDVFLASANAFTGANTFTNTTGQIFRPAATQDGILLRGRAGGTTSRTVEIIPTTLTASRVLTAPDVDGTIVTTGDTGSVTSAMIADLTVANGDIATNAAIAYSKLASMTGGSVLLGNASNIPTVTALSGDVTVSNTGVTAIGAGVIVNADVNASAAIAGSKISPVFGAQTISNTGSRCLIGSTSSITTAIQPGLQVQGTGELSYMNAGRWSADVAGPGLLFGKSRGASIGTRGAVVNGDTLGEISFYGDNGTSFTAAATITGATDGAVSGGGAADMPGRIVFATTADGAGSVTEAMRVTSGQELLIGYTTDNGAYRLQVNSQIFATSATVATSDGRFKDNVATLGGCVDLIKALRPVSFTWKPQQDITRIDEDGKEVLVREGHNFPSGTQVGFIAQEVKQVLTGKPWLTSVIKHNVRPAVTDAEGNELAAEEEFFGIAEGNLIAVLTSALQEAIAKIEVLEAKVAVLENA